MISLEIQNEILKSFRIPFKPLDTRPIYEWVSDNVLLPAIGYSTNGKFNVEISPYLKEPLQDLTDDSVRQVTLGCSTQTFKSGIQEIWTPWIVANAPANMLRLHQTDPAAAQCMATRISPMLNSNADLQTIQGKEKYNTKSHVLNLPPNMFIKACGSSDFNLQSLSIKYAAIDELYLLTDPLVVDKVRARTTSFGNNYKICISSQPDVEGSQLHIEFIKGRIKHWGWHCPNCNVLQDYEFNGEKDGKYYGLIWTPQNKAGTYTYDERTNDTRLVCQHCFHSIPDNEDDKRIKLINSGKYIQLSEGNIGFRSYSWSQFVNKDFTFKKIAMQYLDAKTFYNNTGDTLKLKLFRNQVMGKFWEKGELIDTPKLLQDIDFKSSDTWADETHRFLVIDVQQNCNYWLVIAASNKVSEARLVDWGVCVGYDELVDIRKKFNVNPLCVAIDSGNDTKPIYKESVQRGEWVTMPNGKKIWAQWLCLKGDGGIYKPRTFYPHKQPDGTTIDRFYGVESRPPCLWAANDKFNGIRARLVLWSNYSIKSLLSNIRDGKVPFKIRFNHRADETFTHQMYSEQLDLKKGRYVRVGKENHLWDCMCQALVMLLMSKCFVPEATSIKQIVDTSPVVEEKE